MARDYKREYALFHGKPEQVRRRAQRNKTRKTFVRAGLVKKGDKKDVDHRDHNPFNQERSNVRVLSQSKNRSIK
jgi:hypothetical protein